MKPSSPLKSLLIASGETPASMALSGKAAASLSSTSCFVQVRDSFWPQEDALSLNRAGHGLQPSCLLPRSTILTPELAATTE